MHSERKLSESDTQNGFPNEATTKAKSRPRLWGIKGVAGAALPGLAASQRRLKYSPAVVVPFQNSSRRCPYLTQCPNLT